MTRTVTVQQVGLTLDLLLYRALGRPDEADTLLSETLRLNPGLAARGTILPLQTVVRLPETVRRRPAGARKVVNLFDD